MSTTLPPSPRARVFRTAIQVILGILVAVPAAVALLPISAAVALAVCGISGALAIVISAGWNAYNAANADV